MKTFKQMLDEEMTTAADAGIPKDTVAMGQPLGKKKKRKLNILTRNYIEIAGKRKRREQ